MKKKGFLDSLKSSFDSLVNEDNLKLGSEQNDFFYAVRRGKADKVLEMLKNGQDPNVYNVSRRTPLHVAISKKNEEMVSLLLKYRADPYKPADDLNKTTPIDTIVTRGTSTMLKLLQKYAVDFNRLDVKGETAIYKAVEENKPEMVESLLRWGCDPLYIGAGKMTPVMLAFKRERTDILEMLMSHQTVSQSLNTPQDFGMMGEPLLQQVLDYGSKETLPLLLKQGTLVNVYNAKGQTPIHTVIENGDVEQASLLVEHGADLNTMPRHGDGYLPLHVACDVWRWQENKTPDMLRMLLFAGANPNVLDTKLKTTPLTILLKNDNIINLPECIDILLEYDAATNVYDKDGKTPLLYAIDLGRGKDKSVIQALLDNGANPNLPEKTTGKTPLHYAVLAGDIEVIEQFIAKGANPLLKDKTGNTALKMARSSGFIYDALKGIEKAANENETPQNIQPSSNKRPKR